MNGRRKRIVVHFPGMRAGRREARIVAELHPDGLLVPVPDGGPVAVLHQGMLLSSRGGLWSVRLGISGAIAPNLGLAPTPSPRGLLLGTGAWPSRPKLQVDVSGLLPALPEPHGSPGSEAKDAHGEHGRRHGRRDGHARPRRPAADAGLPNLPEHVVVADALRLVTGLVLDVGPERLRAALTGDGVALELDAAPDYVWLAGAAWVRSSEWPTSEGRLFAPRDADGRLFGTFALGLPDEVPSPGVLGIRILPNPGAAAPVGPTVDWRDDRQVLEDADSLWELLRRRGVDPDAAAAVSRLLDGLAAMPSARFGGREEFRLRRLVDVALERAKVPPALAAMIPGMDGINDLIGQQRDALRAEMLAGLRAEVEVERRRLTGELDAVRRELQAAETRNADLVVRELAVRRALDEVRSDLDGAVERRVDAAVRAVAETAREFRSRVEAHEARLMAVTEWVEASSAAIDELRRSTREGLSEMAGMATRLSALEARAIELPRSEAAERFVGTAGSRAPQPVVTNPADARALLRWHGRQADVGEEVLSLAVAVVLAGLLPLFVGEAAAEAAGALAEAVGGPNYGAVACDPTLISASDLLDPRRARVDVFLRSFASAAAEPRAWHAVALLCVDHAPCDYWLPTLSSRRFGDGPFPPNVHLVAATGAGGLRNPISKASLRRVCPIPVARWTGGNAARPAASGAWASDIGSMTSEGRSEIHEAFLDLADELPPALLNQVREGAVAACRVLGWTAERARDAFRPVADWLAFAGCGRPGTSAVSDLMSQLSVGEQ